MSDHANIHRFLDKVAIYIGTGETIYLDELTARKIARALNKCARDIKESSFVDSKFTTTQINYKG